MIAIILGDSCVFEVSLERVNKERYLYVPIEYNVIASQIMDFNFCIAEQRWMPILLLIGFVHLHRVICLIHACTYNILYWCFNVNTSWTLREFGTQVANGPHPQSTFPD